MNDIRQIEVIRGPASAVWGANALTGGRQHHHGSRRGSARHRRVGERRILPVRDAGSTTGKGPGGLFGANASVSRILNDKWSYRVSAGYFNSDAYPRPTGTIPVIPDPRVPGATVGGARYPTMAMVRSEPRSGIVARSQPKFDLRFDQEARQRQPVDVPERVAGTDGIIYTGIGPFDIQSGSTWGTPRVDYTRRAVRSATSAASSTPRPRTSCCLTRRPERRCS